MPYGLAGFGFADLVHIIINIIGAAGEIQRKIVYQRAF
jgi:hypothetical protein